MTNPAITGIHIPGGKLARAASELVRDTESGLLFQHSTRAY